MNQPFFSIIIPTLNSRDSLFTLIDNIDNQSFQDFELIIVTQINKLSINKLKYLKNLANKIKIINLSTPGLSYAKNVGILNASGRFTYFIDDDCEICEDFLQNAHNILNENKIDLLFGSIFNRDQNSFILKHWPEGNLSNILE